MRKSKKVHVFWGFGRIFRKKYEKYLCNIFHGVNFVTENNS